MGLPRSERALFLSLRPRFAELVLAGQKRVELRRVRPRAQPGTLVLVYATSPRRELVGSCIVAAIASATPDEIWRLHGQLAAVPKSEYREYFVGTNRAVAITVSSPRRLREPIPLKELRALIPSFAPPQSFRYLPLADAEALLRAEAVVCESEQQLGMQ